MIRTESMFCGKERELEELVRKCLSGEAGGDDYSVEEGSVQTEGY